MPRAKKLTEEKVEETKEHEICGQPLSKIREAYHQKKLQPMLEKMLASGLVTDETTAELTEFLQSEQEIGEGLVNNLIAVFGGKIINEADAPPSAEELMAGIEWTQDEEEKAMSVVNYIETELNNLRHNIHNQDKNKKPIPPSYWLDTSTKFLSYELLLSRYYVYKSQLFNAEITKIIDKKGCSRLEAENRAKLTKEYADYKMVQRIIGEQNLTGIIERFENLSKKYDAKPQ